MSLSILIRRGGGAAGILDRQPDLLVLNDKICDISYCTYKYSI